MNKHEATERLNELAWYLTDLADEIALKWQPSVKRWGNDENNVFDIGRTIEQWLDGTDDVAMQIELHLESGPARRERFADVVVGIWDEARAIERTIVLGNPDPFRWAREDIHSAAAEFPNELRRAGEYLWGLYALMGGEPASANDDSGTDDEESELNLLRAAIEKAGKNASPTRVKNVGQIQMNRKKFYARLRKLVTNGEYTGMNPRAKS